MKKDTGTRFHNISARRQPTKQDVGIPISTCWFFATDDKPIYEIYVQASMDENNPTWLRYVPFNREPDSKLGLAIMLRNKTNVCLDHIMSNRMPYNDHVSIHEAMKELDFTDLQRDILFGKRNG